MAVEQVHEEQAQESPQAQENRSPRKPLAMERARLYLSQKEMARKSGLTESAYIQIEKGRVKPRLVNAQRIIDAINEERLKRSETNFLTVYSLDWEPQGLPPRA